MAHTEPNITAENTAAHLTENTAERLAENTAVHLIAMAYSGTLDPSTYMNEDILNDVICLADMVVRAMVPPEADYEWRSERAELLLEAEEIDDARHTELLAGSSLTPEEEERFRELADWEAECDDGWAISTAWPHPLRAVRHGGGVTHGRVWAAPSITTRTSWADLSWTLSRPCSTSSLRSVSRASGCSRQKPAMFVAGFCQNSAVQW